MHLEFTQQPLPGAGRGLEIPPTALDPHYAWATADQFASHGGPDQTFLVAFEMPLKVAGKDEKTVRSEVLERLGGPGVHLHPVWWNQDFVYGTALLDAEGLRTFEKAAASRRIKRFEVALVPESARSAARNTPVLAAGAPPTPKCQEKTLYGVVDFGCPLAHRRLRTQHCAGTRVLHFWDQEGAFAIPGAVVPPDWGFGSGAESAAIDGHFGSSAAADDWALYRNAGLPGLCRDASHGAHLLGCLFGAHANSTLLWNGVRDHVPVPLAVREPETADLVFVQLPSAYLQGVPRTALGPYRLAALRHILEYAGPDTREIVVPLSSENYDGSHDGQSLFDQAVDALVDFGRKDRNVGMAVLVSAGNSLRTNTHQRVDLAKETSGRFPLRVPPGNERETYVELWMPGSLDTLEFALQAPHATAEPEFRSGDGVWLASDPLGRQVAAIVSLRQPAQAGDSQRCVLFVLRPTQGSGPTGIAGDWRISVRVPAGTQPGPGADVCAYIARSTAALGGWRRGYQATFLRAFSSDWDFERDAPAGPARPYDPFSINGLATARTVTVVGGYQARTGERALYSAGGPARVPGRIGGFLVNAGAPSDESRNFQGIVAWGNRSAGFVRFAGTSVAAPLAARVRARLGELPTDAGGGRKDPQVRIPNIVP